VISVKLSHKTQKIMKTNESHIDFRYFDVNFIKRYSLFP
jgi:hypothetical protein